MNGKILSFIMIFSVLLFSSCRPADSSAEKLRQVHHGHMLLGADSFYMFTEKEESLEEILKPERSAQFRKNKTDYPNFGIQSRELWLKVELDLNENTESVIEAASPLLSKIRFFQYCDGRQTAFYQSGMDLPNEKLPLHPNYQFPVSPWQGKCQFYLALQSNDSMTVPLFYWEKSVLQKFDTVRHLLFGLFFGLMISLALYNFLLFLSIKSRAYLWYVFYILSFTVFYLTV